MDSQDTTPCVVCGRAPTLTRTIRAHRGMVFVQQFRSLKRPLCRDHGVQMTKKFQNDTLVQGWWGLISFFVNWFNVFSNIATLRAYKSLPEPQGAVHVPSTAAAQPTANAVAAWYADPTKRFQMRYFDGSNWTTNVATNGQVSQDPVTA